MLGSNRGRFHLAGGLLGTALALGILACAGSAARQEPAASPSAGIADIVVESEGTTSRLTVLGPADPIFTAFQQSDPDRLIVDLAGVESTMSSAPIPVYDGRVEEISVAPFPTGSGETMARVEIALAGPVDYDVRPGQGGLVIEVTGLESMSEMSGLGGEGHDSAPAEQDPWALPPDSAPFEPMTGEFEETREAPADLPAAGAIATTLRRVESEQAEGGVVIHLVSDGALESTETFTLDDPARLVIDLAGMKSDVKPEKIEVGSSHVSRIRVGAHADKVRVVMDAGTAPAPFDGRQVLPVATGLLVALGSGPAVEAAVAGAEAPAPAMQAHDAAETHADTTVTTEAEGEARTPAREPGSGPVTIYGVEFDSQGETDRVVVLGEHAVDYLVYEPDAETVVVSLEEAVLDPDAAVRLTPEPGGPVSLVTAFEQPDVVRPEVRVVVKRAADLQPVVSRRGALLMIDFARDGAAAATPPVLGMAEQTLPADGSTAAGTDAGIPIDTGHGLEGLPAEAPPASLAPTGAAVAGMPADPAAIDPPASIAILNEGGLMDGKEYVGRRISLDFKEVEIADVLRLIAEVSDLNVIAGDEVKGKVTIRLVDVPWDQALDVILLTKGLGFIRIGNVLRIAASEVIAQEEELRLQERRAKEKLEDLVVKLQPVNYADVKDISKMVKQLLTPRGSVNTDTRTNTLIIKDIASVIDEATALIKAVDTMTPQVMIEAKIVEASLDFSRELGSKWQFGSNPLTESTLGGRDYVFQPGDDDDIADDLGNQFVFGNPITTNPTGLLGLAASVLDERFNFEVELQAAEINGDGKVISSPRIVTLDNSKAQIEQGVSIPFQTFENGDAQLEFVDAVLQLKTTPHITSDKSIIMEIEVSRNAPDDSVFTLTGSPAIAKNQVKTETLVKDGQTLVLGGIYVVDKSERESRVPYLHRVPFLGNLFKSHEFSDSRKELLIFVTPRIVQTEAIAS